MWVHLNLHAKKSQQWLRNKSGLDRLTAGAMLVEDARPRSIFLGNGILASLRGVNSNPGQDPEDMVLMHTWIDQHCIITTRSRQLLSVMDIRESLDQGRGPKSPAEFLITLNERMSAHMEFVVNNAEDSVDELEERLLTIETRELRPLIAEVRRQSIMLRRYISPQREALNALYNEESIEWFTREHRRRIRESLDCLIRYIEDLDSVRERAAVVHEELISRLSEQMESKMFLLSIVAVIFLPVTFITGLLGINVGGIPGAENKHGFLVVCAFLFVIIWVTILLLKRKRWIP